MDTWIWLAIGAFIVVDGLITFFVLRHSRAKKQQEAAGGSDDLSRKIGLE